MGRNAQPRRMSPGLRLQVVLLLLITWDVLALAAEVTFGGPLFKFSSGKIDGLLGAAGGFNGAAVVPLVLYIYAFVRGPGQRASLLWVGVIEHLSGALFAVFHLASGDLRFGASIAQLVISLAMVVVVLLNIPREPATPSRP